MRAVILLLAAVVPGCAAAVATEGPIGPAPRIDGFPTSYFEGAVAASAWLRNDHAELLRTDLVTVHRVLPIWVSVSLREGHENDGQIQLLASQLDMRLYLPDGTALAPADIDALQRQLGTGSDSQTRVRRRLFEPGPLAPLELVSSRVRRGDNDGFVYFALPGADELTIRGTQCRHARGGVTKMFDVADSLVSFNVSIGGTLQTVFVGLQ